MEILLEPKMEGYVILSLAEYERLKQIEREANEMWEANIKRILKGESK